MKPTGYDPAMRRPVTIVVGAALVLLRVAAGVAWIADVGAHWSGYAGDVAVRVGDLSLSPDAVRSSFVVFAALSGLVLLVESALAILILRGADWARIVVMSFAVVSISSSFGSWWAQGQEITLNTSLVSLALDILVLLALSSRSAAAYARRNERR
nr:hypothetical protein [Microbacterium ulmi]